MMGGGRAPDRLRRMARLGAGPVGGPGSRPTLRQPDGGSSRRAGEPPRPRPHPSRLGVAQPGAADPDTGRARPRGTHGATRRRAAARAPRPCRLPRTAAVPAGVGPRAGLPAVGLRTDAPDLGAVDRQTVAGPDRAGRAQRDDLAGRRDPERRLPAPRRCVGRSVDMVMTARAPGAAPSEAVRRRDPWPVLLGLVLLL